MSIKERYFLLKKIIKYFLKKMTKKQIKALFPTAKYSGKSKTWYIAGKAYKSENIRFSIFW